MKLHLASMTCIALICAATALHGQDISGTWQGRTTGQRVFKIVRVPKGGFRGQMYMLDGVEGSLYGNPLAVTVRNGEVTFRNERKVGIFEGKLSPEKRSIIGTWRNSAGARALTLQLATKSTAWPIDPSPHHILMVTVQKNVSLEVLDWGGSGPPLIFLPGIGMDAHTFDSFAPKFTGNHHVFGITRRGFGASNAPAPTTENYEPDRLGDDVLAVMKALKINRPVLAGHSIAGQELSSIGTRYPDQIAGLVYLDSAYGYAFYVPEAAAQGADWDGPQIDRNVVQRDLARLSSADPSTANKLISELRETIPRLENSLKWFSPSVQPVPRPPQTLIDDAILSGGKRYSKIGAPVLAIYAYPKDCKPDCDSAATKAWLAGDEKQIEGFKNGNPKAKIVQLPLAEHVVFRSNETDVLREMNAFMDALPR